MANNQSLTEIKSLQETLTESREQFTMAMQEATSLDVVDNLSGAFDTAIVVQKLEAILTDDIMNKVFMPLMNKKIGFKTDRDPSRPSRGVTPTPYPVATVRTCIIDAAANGLMPTGNQFNIIAGNMYPTKEGYTALLTKLKQKIGLVYTFAFDPECTAKSADPNYVAIGCKIYYDTNIADRKGSFSYVAMVKSNGETSTTDQLRGKAERKCKKAFFEFLTGLDLGDADADTVDTTYTDVSTTPTKQSAIDKAKAIAAKRASQAQAEMQPNTQFETQTEMRIDANKADI